MRLPARGVALEVFALALQQTGTDLLSSHMVLAWIVNLLGCPHGNGRIDNLVVVRHKVYPLLVLGHRDGPVTQLLDDGICVVGFALEDASIGVVGLLNFADNNGL